MDEDALRLTQDLIRLDTRNPGSVEHPAAELLAERLAVAGCDVELTSFGPGRTSVIARAGDRSGPILGLTGHLDTVPLGQADWSVPPFGAVVDGDRLYGRGASDMKGGVAAMVVAVERVLAARAERPSLEIVLTAGEETGSEGAVAIAAGDLLAHRVDGLLVAEPTDNRAIVAHKGVLWLQLTAHGRSAHGSMPELGDNAAYRMASAVLTLRDLPASEAHHRMLGVPTLSVGTMRAGSNTNSVPDLAEATVDLRTLPGQSHARMVDELRELLRGAVGDGLDVVPILDLPGIETAPDEPFVGSVLDAIAHASGRRPEPGATTYFTDASVLTPRYGGPPTVICGPGDPTQAHQTDEYCRLDRLAESVVIYRHILENWPTITIR